MKKLVFIMPLMAISLLASCGGQKPSVDQFTVTFDAVEGEFPIVGKITSLKVDPNESLVLAIRAIVSPIKDGTNFAYFTYSDGTNISYGDKVTSDITLKAKYINSTLEALSWNEIEHIATAGHPDTYFIIGEEKSVTLNDWNEEVLTPQSFAHKVRIIDFYYDDLADGSGKAGITFEFANVITKANKTDAITTIWDGEYEVNGSGNNFDYRESTLNNLLNDGTEGAKSVFNMLPNDLKEKGIIKPVNKLVGVNESETVGKDNYIATPFEEDKCPKLFSLAFEEIHNHDLESYVTPGEATSVYRYYKAHGEDTKADQDYRIKNIVDGSGKYYWLRSPYVNSDCISCFVADSGAMGNGHVYWTPCPVAPAFCI